mmetsp:Transcript_13603/g.26988  ORF Transcript_13603/g.26988 Transcript_13603/m.26988 type:complete len:361 (-) Transcript_13603:152-1234(-)
MLLSQKSLTLCLGLSSANIETTSDHTKDRVLIVLIRILISLLLFFVLLLLLLSILLLLAILPFLLLFLLSVFLLFLLLLRLLLCLILLLLLWVHHPVVLGDLAVEGIHCSTSSFGILEVHESEGTALLVLLQGNGSDGAELLEHTLHRFFSPALRQILDVEVSEGLNLGMRALCSLLERAHIHGLGSDLHAVDTLHSGLSGFLAFVVHEAIPERLSLSIRCDLAGKDVAEKRERVIQRFVVDVLVQVLHEDIASARLAKRGVTVAPHDTARVPLDRSVVEGVEGTLGIGNGVVVHVRITERASRDRVATNANRGNGANGVEDLVQGCLRDVRRQIPNVQGCGSKRLLVGHRAQMKELEVL